MYSHPVLLPVVCGVACFVVRCCEKWPKLTYVSLRIPPLDQGREDLPHEPVRQQEIHITVQGHHRRRLPYQGSYGRRQAGDYAGQFALTPGGPKGVCLM